MPYYDVIVDLESNSNEYYSKGYQMVNLPYLPEDYVLYYTNTKIDNDIVVKFIKRYSIPRYINPFNLDFYEDSLFDYFLFSALSSEIDYAQEDIGVVE